VAVADEMNGDMSTKSISVDFPSFSPPSCHYSVSPSSSYRRRATKAQVYTSPTKATLQITYTTSADTLCRPGQEEIFMTWILTLGGKLIRVGKTEVVGIGVARLDEDYDTALGEEPVSTKQVVLVHNALYDQVTWAIDHKFFHDVPGFGRHRLPKAPYPAECYALQALGDLNYSQYEYFKLRPVFKAVILIVEDHHCGRYGMLDEPWDP